MPNTEHYEKLAMVHRRIHQLRAEHDTGTQNLAYAYTMATDGTYTLKWGIVQKNTVKDNEL